MKRYFPIFLISLLLPASTFAAKAPASFSAGQSILAASSSPGNEYVAGASIVVTAPVSGDLSAVGGSIISAAPVSGDDFLLAGSVDSRESVAGDLRAAGGSVTIEKPVAGDIVAFGVSVNDSGRAGGSVFVTAMNTIISNGASGPVVIYGNNVSLAGNFANNVTVMATGRVKLEEGTTIHGAFSYESPQTAIIPESATIKGGIDYKDISYLPDAGTSRVLAFVSVGFFLLVRILSMLILAGLLTGLFPRFAEAITECTYTARPRKILLTTLLGFAVLAATPILFLMLMLTFVGFGIALLIILAYALLVFLSVMYAGILLGSVLARRFARREIVLWRDGVLGMLALSLIALIPFVGVFVILLLTIFSAGMLLTLFFKFAFPHEESTTELL